MSVRETRAAHFTSDDIPGWLAFLLAVLGAMLSVGCVLIIAAGTGGLEGTLGQAQAGLTVSMPFADPSPKPPAPAVPTGAHPPSATALPPPVAGRDDRPILPGGALGIDRSPAPETRFPAPAATDSASPLLAALPAPHLPERAEDAHAAGAAPSRGCAPVFTVTFPTAQWQPRPLADDPRARALSRWMQANPEALLLLEGQADARGDPEFNLILSYRRATAVKSELLALGVPAERLKVRALGAARPAAGERLDEEASRRTSLRALGWDTCPQPVPASEASLPRQP